MKTTQEIYEAMLAALEERSGFAPDDSCDLAVRLFAAAAQLESLYAYADWSRAQCFPQTAVGEYLDRHAALRRVDRVQAACAAGTLTVYLPQALGFSVTVPENSSFAVQDGPVFHLTQACTIAAGATSATASAQCNTAGTAGNVAAGEICCLIEAPSYVSRVANLAPFTGGQDAESDDHLRARVLEACRRAPTGANKAFYEAIALAQPGITSAVAIPHFLGDGTVTLCLSGNYGTPTAAQIAAVRAALADRTELGITLSILSPVTESVDISLSVWPVDGISASQAIAAARAAIEAMLERPMLSRGFFRSEAGSRVYNTGLVKNFAFTLPTEDRLPTPTKLFTLGTLQITEGS